MRKLLALLIPIPFATLLVLSCDEYPTAPENALAATTVQASSAPQANRPPTVPVGTKLGNWTLVQATVTIPSYETATVFVPCPPGSAPVTGGFENDGTFELWANRPAVEGDAAGWYVGMYNRGEGVLQDMTAYAACVAATIAE